MKNSAGVKFNDNTDLIIEADPSGEVTSCFNRSNDTEYVGGGGGDFSTAEVMVHLGSLPILPCGGIFIVNDVIEDTVVFTTENDTHSAVLYKGGPQMLYFSEHELQVSGNATITDDGVSITGDCEITVIS